MVSRVLFSIGWWRSFYLPVLLRMWRKSATSSFGGKIDGGKAKVAWNLVVVPIEEGGVGIRDMRSSNVANVLRHVWQLLLRAGSIWVTWVYYYRIKRECLWRIYSAAGSSHWRRLFKLRDVVQVHTTLDCDDMCDVLYMPCFQLSRV
ncbi:hypothetical protein LINPERHAP2_LOCUS20010 [Linum perenne]